MRGRGTFRSNLLVETVEGMDCRREKGRGVELLGSARVSVASE